VIILNNKKKQVVLSTDENPMIYNRYEVKLSRNITITTSLPFVKLNFDKNVAVFSKSVSKSCQVCSSWIEFNGTAFLTRGASISMSVRHST
jgi:hypothetical protein